MQVEKYTNRDQISLIIFEIGREEFAIDLLEVKEIVQSGQIKRLPRSLDYIEGIYNYRGEIIHIINLKKKLNLEEYKIYDSINETVEKTEEKETSNGQEESISKDNDKLINIMRDNSGKKYIIIMNLKDITIGFIVDRIINVTHIGQNEIEPLSPIFQTSIIIDYINGIIKFPDKPRILINLGKVLSESEQVLIQKENSSLSTII